MLLVIGGLNWGMVAVAETELVAALFGAGSLSSKAVYGLGGLAAIYQGMSWKTIQTRWQWRIATVGH